MTTPPTLRYQCLSQRPFSSWCLLCILSLLCATTWYCPTLTAASNPDIVPKSIEIRGEMPWANQEAYTPIVITLIARNNDTIDLRASAEDGRLQAHKSIAIKAGQRSHCTLLIPSSLSEISYASITWRSQVSGETGTFNCSADLNYRGSNVLVLDRDPSLVNNDFLQNLPKSNASYSSGKSYSDFASNSLPDYWQGIPSWLCLLITPKAQRNLSTAQMHALQQWTQAGGNLFASTPAVQAAFIAQGINVRIANADASEQLTQAVAAQNSQAQSHINQYPVPGTDNVPATAFISILIVFIIIVGPLNYLWVRKTKQIHLFLITTPCLSFAFCIVIAGYGLIADGLSAQRSVVELTVIDFAHKQSCTWQSISWFSGLSPGPIAVSLDSEIRLITNDTYDRYRSRSYYMNDDIDEKSLSSDWGTQQIASGEWLQSRSHQQIQIAAPHTEERRLILQRDGASYRLSNGFESTLNAFSWQDSRGSIWYASHLASGSSVLLTQKKQQAIALQQASHNSKRFSPNVQIYWHSQHQATSFTALFDKTLHPIAGPTATDSEPPCVLVCGLLEAEVQP